MSERIGPTGNVCYMCRMPLEQPKRGRMRLTCSNECRQARYRYLRLGQWSWEKKRAQKRNEQRRKIPFVERRFNKADYPPVFELSHRRVVRECMTCGDQFIVDGSIGGVKRTYFCSDRCNKIKKDRWKEFEAARRAHQVDHRVRERYLQGKLSPLCAHCGKPFAPNTTAEGEPLPGRPRKYCSTACGKLAYEKRYRSAHRGRARRHRYGECAECGSRLDRKDKQGRIITRFCKPECANSFKSRARYARIKAQASGQTAFKQGSSGRRAAILGSVKNRSKRFDRNEPTMVFSGGVGKKTSSGTKSREELGDLGAKNPAFISDRENRAIVGFEYEDFEIS